MGGFRYQWQALFPVTCDTPVFFYVSAMGARKINSMLNKLEMVRKVTLELFGDATYK